MDEKTFGTAIHTMGVILHQEYSFRQQTLRNTTQSSAALQEQIDFLSENNCRTPQTSNPFRGVKLRIPEMVGQHTNTFLSENNCRTPQTSNPFRGVKLRVPEMVGQHTNTQQNNKTTKQSCPLRHFPNPQSRSHRSRGSIDPSRPLLAVRIPLLTQVPHNIIPHNDVPKLCRCVPRMNSIHQNGFPTINKGRKIR